MDEDDNLQIPTDVLLRQVGIQQCRIWSLQQENAELKQAVKELAEQLAPTQESPPEQP